MTITPGDYEIVIYQGTTYSQVFTWKDENGDAINLTGYTARMQARTAVDASSTFISLTSGSGITLGGAAGTITITMTDTQTSAITASGGVYDLELVSAGGSVTRLLQGNLIVSREVTR